MDEQKIVNCPDQDLERDLTTLHTSYELLSTRQKQGILKIQQAVRTAVANFEEAKASLKNNLVNPTNIARESGITRKTFYNNDLYKDYVSLHSNDTVFDDNGDEIKTLREKNRNLQNELDNIVKQVCKYELEMCDIEKLNDANETLKKQITFLQEKIAKQETELKAKDDLIKSLGDSSPNLLA